MTFYFKTLVIFKACPVVTVSSPSFFFFSFASIDFHIQLVGAFTSTAITSEIIQYVMQSGIGNKIPHVLSEF